MGWLEIQREVEEDPQFSKVINELQAKVGSIRAYNLGNGILLFKGRVVVAPASDRTSKMIEEFHSTPSGGHSGAYKTYKRLAGSRLSTGPT